MKISIIGRSVLKPISETEDIKVSQLFGADKVKRDMIIMAGKAAGICYMPDDYLSEGIQNNAKAIARASNNSKSGHYSTFEHGHINFIIEADKIMAMILNSMGLYCTSEKSARYTAMNPESEKEKELYAKWKKIFFDLIYAYYKETYNEKQIEKLAMENARYMISVFTPTVMEYTIPFNRIILTCIWLDELADNINIAIDNNFKTIKANETFYKRVGEECKELARLFREQININTNDYIFNDHKRMGIELFYELSSMYKLKGLVDFTNPDEVDKVLGFCFSDNIPIKSNSFGDSYTSNYQASFAEFAQAQRHRTLKYTIKVPDTHTCYVPRIIRNSKFELEWINDFNSLISENITPQGMLLNICEQGRFEDFVTKCKERLCSRAQLEIMEVTRDQVCQFAIYKNNLNPVNMAILMDMISYKDNNYASNSMNIQVEARCNYTGYICKEPCSIGRALSNYYRNV